MADFIIPENPTFSAILKQIEVTDPVHADILNALIGRLLVNDVYLENRTDASYVNSTGYTDGRIAELINGAPSTLDTLKELAQAVQENQPLVDALDAAIGTKAAQAELDTHTGNAAVHVTGADKSKWDTAGTKADTALQSIQVGGVAQAKTDGMVNLPAYPSSVAGNAGTATKLQTPRSISITGGATGSATAFDGAADITIPVTALDISRATVGTLPLDHGGTGAVDAVTARTNLGITPSSIGAATEIHSHSIEEIRGTEEITTLKLYIWMLDYKTYGQNSYVFQDEAIWPEFIRSRAALMDNATSGTVFEQIGSTSVKDYLMLYPNVDATKLAEADNTWESVFTTDSSLSEILKNKPIISFIKNKADVYNIFGANITTIKSLSSYVAYFNTMPVKHTQGDYSKTIPIYLHTAYRRVAYAGSFYKAASGLRYTNLAGKEVTVWTGQTIPMEDSVPNILIDNWVKSIYNTTYQTSNYADTISAYDYKELL